MVYSINPDNFEVLFEDLILVHLNCVRYKLYIYLLQINISLLLYIHINNYKKTSKVIIKVITCILHKSFLKDAKGDDGCYKRGDGRGENCHRDTECRRKVVKLYRMQNVQNRLVNKIKV